MFTPAVLVFALLLGFSLSFAGKKSQVESVPQEEMEVSGAADDGVDPFITKNREWFKQYHTTGYYDWIGPNGETITGDDDLVLTNGEVKKLREGSYAYALIANNMAGEYMVALADGLDSYFNHLGIKRVAFTTAEFDPAKQKSDVETVLAKKPGLIIGHPTDPITAAESFQPAVDAGIPIAMLDQLPKGYEYGKDIIGVVTENHVELATYSAEVMNQILGDGGKVGVVYYDDVYYVCNILDDTFVDTLEEKYPSMEIVSKMGWVEEQGAGNVAAGMILRDPDIEGIWVTYMTPAQSVLAALKDSNRTDIQVVTYGIDMPTLVNIAQGGSMTITGASPWNIGMDLAIMGGYGLLGKEVPNYYITVPGFIVTRDMVREVWENSMPYEMPDLLKKVLEEAGL